MPIVEFLDSTNLAYAINPITFISQLKNEYVLMFKEIISMQDVDHFTIGLNTSTKHSTKVFYLILMKSV